MKYELKNIGDRMRYMVYQETWFVIEKTLDEDYKLSFHDGNTTSLYLLPLGIFETIEDCIEYVNKG